MKTIAALISIFLVAACSTYRSMPAEEQRTLLAELDQRTLAELVEKHPEAQAEIDASVGHAVFLKRVTKIPIVGAGDGIGVVVDNETGERTHLKVGRFDIGGGLGVRTYRLIYLFLDRGALKQLAGGKLKLGAGAEAGSGTKEVGTGPSGVGESRKDEYVVYQLAETGVSATITVRIIKYSVLDLED
jgi:hypothetical protein